MEAELLPGGDVRVIISPLFEVVPPAYQEFDHLIGFISEAREGLWRQRDAFPTRIGTTYEELRSLNDELLLIRYDLLGTPRPYDLSTDRFDGGTKEASESGTAWDQMPKIEATLLSDGRLTLTLRRGELAIFANCIDVALDTLKAKVSRVGREEFWIRRGMRPEEAEKFRDELRLLDLETRVRPSS